MKIPLLVTTSCKSALPIMAFIEFSGLVVAWNPQSKLISPLVVCCLSRMNEKQFRIVSLEGEFDAKEIDCGIKVGSLVHGKAKIIEIWDGSILVEFAQGDFCVIAGANAGQLQERSLGHGNMARLMYEVRRLGKIFYRGRLSRDYYPCQYVWPTHEHYFSDLAQGLLGHDGNSLASLGGEAIFVKKIRPKAIKDIRHYPFLASDVLVDNGHSIPIKKGKAQIGRLGIFLLLVETCKIHSPVFMLATVAQGERLEKGSVYKFHNLPIFQAEDAHAEDEAVLLCGIAHFSKVSCPDAPILSRSYDELANAAAMPEWLWEKYFSKNADREILEILKRKVMEHLRASRVPIPSHPHGWWYYWEPVHALKSGSGIETLILAPAFRDGGAPRALILPKEAYKRNRGIFPAYSSAVSVSCDPQIIEGDYVPDPGSWALIRNWIIGHMYALKKEFLDLDDIYHP